MMQLNAGNAAQKARQKRFFPISFTPKMRFCGLVKGFLNVPGGKFDVQTVFVFFSFALKSQKRLDPTLTVGSVDANAEYYL